MKTYNLVHGAMPQLGFGTFQLKGANAREMVHVALQTGYRHIDTAQIYENEAEVGLGLLDSGVPRGDIFLTTKVWVDHFDKTRLRSSVDESLEKLKTDYVDLLLLHWPNPNVPLAESLEALAAVQDAGLARDIGVSNFTVDLLRQCEKHLPNRLSNNQIEYHALLSQEAVLAESRRQSLVVTAYSPLAQGELLSEPTVKEIAKKHGKHAGEIALSWLLQQERIAVIPRSSKADHVRSNYETLNLKLDDSDMAALNQLSQKRRRVVNPKSLAPDWD